jgi:hypothetical protein
LQPFLQELPHPFPTRLEHLLLDLLKPIQSPLRFLRAYTYTSLMGT